MVKRYSLFKKKNINNGSGVNNNNSNEGEKTKETVLGLPPKRGQTLSVAFEEEMVEASAEPPMAGCSQPLALPYLPGYVSLSMETLKGRRVRRVRQLEKWVAAGDGVDGDDAGGDGGDAGGAGGDNGGSGREGDGDNDGGDKTEGGGGGGDGDGGKMGTKMEPKGQHDNRNRFSYHGGDENGNPVRQLHRCYYEKPNVCSIITY